MRIVWLKNDIKTLVNVIETVTRVKDLQLMRNTDN